MKAKHKIPCTECREPAAEPGNNLSNMIILRWAVVGRTGSILSWCLEGVYHLPVFVDWMKKAAARLPGNFWRILNCWSGLVCSHMVSAHRTCRRRPGLLIVYLVQNNQLRMDALTHSLLFYNSPGNSFSLAAPSAVLFRCKTVRRVNFSEWFFQDRGIG